MTALSQVMMVDIRARKGIRDFSELCTSLLFFCICIPCSCMWIFCRSLEKWFSSVNDTPP